MKNPRPSASRPTWGFTLIELLVVVALVGILAAIAYPSFRNSVLKSRRSEAISTLMDTAQRLERCFTAHRSYTSANCQAYTALPFSTEYFQIDISGATTTTYTLSAVAQGTQASDTRCRTFRIVQTGRTQALDSSDADSTSDCWR